MKAYRARFDFVVGGTNIEEIERKAELRLRELFGETPVEYVLTLEPWVGSEHDLGMGRLPEYVWRAVVSGATIVADAFVARPVDAAGRYM